MFEHRLGLALGKSLGEVRALPAPEYRRWLLFYLVEPWGFADREYRTGAQLAMLYNINRGKAKEKDARAFMRDMPGEILKNFLGQPAGFDLEAMSPEERREFIIAAIKSDFGIS